MSITGVAKAESMSEVQLNAVMGSLLGDATLQYQGGTTASIRWNHGWCQNSYVAHKYTVLQEFATKPPQKKPNPGYGDFWSVLTLRSTGTFHCLYTLMFQGTDRHKSITAEYLSQITHPIALAWWFMDDGSRQKGVNHGYICTNGFTKAEVQLLSSWLKERWGVISRIQQVTHPNGSEGWQLQLPAVGYIRLMQLIAPYVPDCMKYKTAILMKVCPICGTVFPQNRKTFCSPECAHIRNTEMKLAWVAENREHVRAVSKAWKEAHREQLNAAARERYRRMTPEQKQAVLEYSRMWREKNRDTRNAYRRQWRGLKKQDPEYQKRLKAERDRYYQKLRQDPERYQKRLAQARERRHTDEVRAKEREYLRKRRAEKRAEDPERQAAYDALKQHQAELAEMTAEERQAHTREVSLKSYYKRQAERTQAEKAARNARIQEAARKRMEAIRADPEKLARWKADEKRRRDARKAKKLAETQRDVRCPFFL